jgi:dihydrodipicolinate synthase/N-acetylneuraminate lyase
MLVKRNRKPLRGIFPLMPLVLTPTRELDLPGLRENIHAYEAQGFDGFIAFGCMGEFYAPSDREFEAIVDTAVDADTTLTTVFGTTAQTTRQCIQRTRYVEAAGGDGVMIGPPSVIPCTEDEVFDHYCRVNAAVDEVQIMAYNNPFTFRFNMTVEFWDRLVTLDRICAVKESNGAMKHRNRVIHHIADHVNVFSGGEVWLLADSLLGGQGIVSTCGPGAPRASIAFFHACMQQDLDRALPLHHKFAQVYSDVTAENEVAWLKAAAELGGFHAGPPRLPYTPLDLTLRLRLQQGLAELNALTDAQ